MSFSWLAVLDLLLFAARDDGTPRLKIDCHPVIFKVDDMFTQFKKN